MDNTSDSFRLADQPRWIRYLVGIFYCIILGMSLFLLSKPLLRLVGNPSDISLISKTLIGAMVVWMAILMWLHAFGKVSAYAFFAQLALAFVGASVASLPLLYEKGFKDVALNLAAAGFLFMGLLLFILVLILKDKVSTKCNVS
jgi:hypothetical protein